MSREQKLKVEMGLLRRKFSSVLFDIWYWFGTLNNNYFIQTYNRKRAVSIEQAREKLKEAWTPKLAEKLNATISSKNTSRLN